MRALAVLLVVLLLAPGVMAWDQMRGEADRSPTIEPPKGVLDVVGVGHMMADNQRINGRTSPYMVSVGDELAGLAVGAGAGEDACTLMRGTFSGGFTGTVLSGCENGRLQAYWEAQGLFIVCMGAGDSTGILAAYTAQGVQEWAKDPRDIVREDGLPGERWEWTCDGAALRGDVVIVPFLAVADQVPGIHHEIVWVSAETGEVDHRAHVPPSALGSDSLGPLGSELQGALGATPDFLPLTVTAVEGGILLSGLVACPQSATCRGPPGAAMGYIAAVVWMDESGATNGIELARPPDAAALQEQEATRPVPLASAFGAGDRGIIVAQAGRMVLYVDPTTTQANFVEVGTQESGQDVSFWPGPVWVGNRIAVPTDRQITFLNRAGGIVGDAWADLLESSERIVDLAADRNERLFILSVKLESPAWGPSVEMGTQATLTILDNEGRELHQLPLSAMTLGGQDPAFTGGGLATAQLGWLQAPAFIEHGGELGIVDAKGNYVFLTDRQEEPHVSISDRFPETTEDVVVTVRSVGNPDRVLLRWGDGSRAQDLDWPENATSFTREHFYSRQGAVDFFVTVLDADGTTRTAARVIEVGGTPPPDLNAIQIAFGEKYRDTTWGIIGILIAVLGGLYAWLRIQRGRSRVRQALARLHQIREQGLSDPVGALKELQELRREIQDRATAGFYDQGQIHILESNMARTARTLMLNGVAPFRDRLNPVYRSMLIGFFEDGRLGDQEAETALEALGKQTKLNATERQRLMDMFAVLKG